MTIRMGVCRTRILEKIERATRIFLWEAMRARGNEIDSLLDLSLSILASTSDFPQKADLEASLKKAQGLLRNLA